MIHFARPHGGGSFCGSIEDVRWMDGRWKKKDCCPTCWRARQSYHKGRRRKSTAPKPPARPRARGPQLPLFGGKR